MKIGLIREWKEPADRRVALSPELCKLLVQRHPEVEILVESSPVRAFADQEYAELGFEVSTDMRSCDLLLGIKEVPIDKLIPHKTYCFFSHTIKAQAYNREMLKAILAKDISLVDYETLVWPKGGRVLGFGKWAGIVGTYNAFLTWGQKFGLYQMPSAHETTGFVEAMRVVKNIRPKHLRIAYTGQGRVAEGIREVLESMHIKEVSPEAFLQEQHETVFVQLRFEDIYKRLDGHAWDDQHFYTEHEAYASIFDRYLPYVDLLINGMYWEDDLPPLFHKTDTASADFRIKVIADITCDVEGSVPITMKATDIHDPTFGWDPQEQRMVPKYSPGSIDVMAVTNLPTELPREASQEFGTLLLDFVLPRMLKHEADPIIEGARITQNGSLTKKYTYLTDFVSK